MATTFTIVFKDSDYDMYFFSCSLCPFVMPFLNERTAYIYEKGHCRNKYHQRRLELLR
jgi:hypothetical protein